MVYFSFWLVRHMWALVILWTLMCDNVLANLPSLLPWGEYIYAKYLGLPVRVPYKIVGHFDAGFNYIVEKDQHVDRIIKSRTLLNSLMALETFILKKGSYCCSFIKPSDEDTIKNSFMKVSCRGSSLSQYKWNFSDPNNVFCECVDTRSICGQDGLCFPLACFSEKVEIVFGVMNMRTQRYILGSFVIADWIKKMCVATMVDASSDELRLLHSDLFYEIFFNSFKEMLRLLQDDELGESVSMNLPNVVMPFIVYNSKIVDFDKVIERLMTGLRGLRDRAIPLLVEPRSWSIKDLVDIYGRLYDVHFIVKEDFAGFLKIQDNDEGQDVLRQNIDSIEYNEAKRRKVVDDSNVFFQS